MTERIELRIGNGRATNLCDYPLPEAPLARRKPSDPRGGALRTVRLRHRTRQPFGELRAPGEQRRRFEFDMAEEPRLCGERYPIDEDFLAALAKMPGAFGCALGFDRLVMLLLVAPRIENIQWTPAPELT